MNRELSFEQRVHNAFATQAAAHLKALHRYLHGCGYDREEFQVFWYHSNNTVWGHGFGRMIGIEQLYLNHIWNIEKPHVALFEKWQREIPELIGHDLRSTTTASAHALSSEVIEVADDGLTVQSFYLTPGSLSGAVWDEEDLATTAGDSNGKSSLHRGNVYMWERYFSEFCFVDGEWKWFHEQVIPDIWGFYDSVDWAWGAYLRSLETKKFDVVSELDLAALGDSKPVHKMYSTTQTFQKAVHPPKPYETLTDENSLSPGYTEFGGEDYVEI